MEQTPSSATPASSDDSRGPRTWAAKPWCDQIWAPDELVVERLQLQAGSEASVRLFIAFDDAPGVDAQRWAVTFTGVSDVTVLRTRAEATVPAEAASQINDCESAGPASDGRFQVLFDSNAFEFTLFAHAGTVQEMSSTATALDDCVPIGPAWPLRRSKTEAMADE
jgi:hypothetical protein